MPFVQDHGDGLAYLISEGDKTYLMVVSDQAGMAFRFGVELPTLARLNVESAARILTKVQKAHAYFKEGENVVVLNGP